LIDTAALVIALGIMGTPPAIALLLLFFPWPRGRAIAAHCLAGFVFGIGYTVVASVFYANAPGVTHSQPRLALGDVAVFSLEAVFFLSLLGGILGAIFGAASRDPRCRRGLWLGAGGGAILALGLPVFALAWPRHPDGLMAGCLIGYLGLPILGAILGGFVTWRDRRRKDRKLRELLKL
jgi:hypothetical protein